ncbi:T9SS type A sorting domain-containing protein [Flavobacterium sp. TBRC 19031]|uniref:T9SS type A sorting domain-containing protein n=1 Tax=Flavobacterium mekongense TaxID=3379707 RepID=UPI00399BFA0A
MKKTILILNLLLCNLIFSQGDSCATAGVLSTNGIYVCPPIITGTYQQVCFAAVSGISAKWFKFTPSSNGVVTISSNLQSNFGINTRLSILTGTCTALSCFAANDDFDSLSITNRLSFIEIAVEAGTTYYVQWDSRWDDSGFDFTYTFQPSNCLPINQFAVSTPLESTSSSSTLRWNHAIGNPDNYVVEWTADFEPEQTINFTPILFTPDSGTFSVKTISNLPPGENISYFISSLCGTAPNYTGQSLKKGPYFTYLAKNLPYNLTFENEWPINVFSDGFTGFQTFESSATSNPANYADGGAGRSAYTFNSLTTTSNAWGYSRAINLTAGQQVNISFKSRLFAFSGTPSPMSLRVTIGLTQNPSQQNITIDNFSMTSSNEYTTHSTSFIAPTTGVYYFGFQNNSAQGSNQTFAFLDTFSFTNNPLTNSEFTFEQLQISPNPTKEIIHFSNNQLPISQIEIIDLNGRVVKKISLHNSLNTSVNIAEIASGIYGIRITTEVGIASHKLIKT